jgi:hypothetical protein
MSLWRDDFGPVGYGGAAAYAAVAHVAGVALLLRVATAGFTAAAAVSALLGVALAAHGRVVAAYLVHEASHGSIFKSVANNTRFGTLCLWMCAPWAPARAANARATHRARARVPHHLLVPHNRQGPRRGATQRRAHAHGSVLQSPRCLLKGLPARRVHGSAGSGSVATPRRNPH